MEEEHIGVCMIILDKAGKQFLLGKRKNGYKAGTLGLPGGRIQLEEPLEEAAKRELREETSLQAKSLHYIGVVRELQKDYNFIHFVYFCDAFTGTPTNTEPDKCEGWNWYELDKLPENILPGHKAALDLFLKQNETLIQLLPAD